VALLALLACAPPSEAPPGVLVVLQEQQAAWVRNFNPLLATGGARWPTRSGIYEPLAVYNRATAAWTPWLATSWDWEAGDGSPPALRVAIREGVRWSDGAPFTAEDVAFTFRLMRTHAALDAGGVWVFLDDVTAEDDDTVRFTFARPYAPGLSVLLTQPVVPAHVWEDVADPVTWTNPDPVATGPFTEVRRFDTQVWELGRNPRYWQGEPAVEAIRFPAISSNDQALLALVQGEVDWAGSFVPAVERTYEARDPHFDDWSPALGDTVFLYTQQARAPLGDVRVRRAVSRAIDRARLVRVAMHDTTVPAHASALSDGYRDWRRDDLPDDDVRFDPDGASALLDAAGWTRGSDGRRHDADGEALTLPILVPAGWSDWVRAAQVVHDGLDAVGIDAPVQGLDFGAWFDRVGRGDFALALGWSVSGDTPYPFYRSLLGSATWMPPGEVAGSNWHRARSDAADALLARFEATVDAEEQRAAMDALQQVFVDELPAVPLFPAPAWGQANDTRFTGFPSADDPYAPLTPNAAPDPLLVLTRLRPRGETP
jgi:peptide/nickel transport system substrate-binding protein